ncbi:MAG TPA: pectinesterase family protein [Chitinophagaceae bacterium]|nr:pectinesterase family protein [Chitinophagaceae bacterium]
MKKGLGLVILIAGALLNSRAQVKIVVDQQGRGDFKTIGEAINSLPDSSVAARTIFIKKGTYREKIFISKHNIVFEGEDRDKTIITQDIARDEWRCDHPDDWGVATMNVNGNDITLKNLTVANDYGFNVKESKTIDCPNDTVTHKRTIATNGHQMALRTMKATRLKAINCHFRAYAGDTVSPWNTADGMFYFKDCVMEGGVDFYCPRGWAWAENCSFFANTGPASIWHDGSGSYDQKTVLINCRFDGYPGFKLGRYHREAQFYIIGCNFSRNMADTLIYHVPTTPIQWGERIYYYNCHRNGGNDFGWYANNFPASLKAEDVTIIWLFKNKWNPLTN